MKILDEKVLNGSTHKVMEIDDGYLIHGHFYDKNTLTVRPLKIFESLGPSEDLAMNQRLINHNSTGIGVDGINRTYGDTIVKDKYEPDVHYVFNTTFRSTTDFSAMKFRKINGRSELVYKSVLGALGLTNTSLVGVLGQSSKFIYLLLSHSATYTTYVFKVDKVTLTATNLAFNLAYSFPTVLHEDETYIYYTASTTYGKIHCFRIDKTNDTRIDLAASFIVSGTKHFSNRSSEPIFTDVDNMYYYSIHCSGSPYKTAFLKHDINLKDANTATMLKSTPVNIDWGTSGIDTLPISATNGTQGKYECFITSKSTGEKYLNVMLYMRPKNTDLTLDSGLGIYTFLINPLTKDLTYKGFTSTASISTIGYLNIKEGNFVVTMTNTDVYFYEFDPIAETFKNIFNDPCNPAHVGIDSKEDIWILTSSYELKRISPFTATDFQIKWNKPNIQFLGAPIDTYFSVEARNFKGALVEVELTIELNGDARFIPSGQKEITIMTATTGPRQVNVQVTGPGTIFLEPRTKV